MIRKIAQWIFVLCLPVFLLTAGIGIVAGGLSLWPGEWGAERYQIRETLAFKGLYLDTAEIKDVYAGLVRYFWNGEEYIDLTVEQDGRTFQIFTEEETIHFKDVKGLLRLDYGLCFGTLVYIITFICLWLLRFKDKRGLASGMVWGSGLTLFIILALAVLYLFNGFGELWTQFHFVFFTNSFWSAEGYMLLLFPEQFFAEAAVFCVCLMIAVSLILVGVGWRMLRKDEKTAA
jgi:integral membrane protein (TIGR01906 family)